MVANQSPTYPRLEILRYLNILGVSQNKLRLYASKLARPNVFRQKFPEQFDDVIIGKVTKGNKRLNQRYFTESPVRLPE